MFSILLVLFAIVGLSLLFLLFLLLISSPKNDVFFGDSDQAVEIVRVVEAHRKIIPICSVQGWCLVSSNSGLRCWKKELSFVVMGSPVTVYGCMKQINCSAVIVLNVIADISTWSEWDFWPEGQTVHLEVSEDPSLHGDQYMQCDQIVVTNTAIQTKPDVIMYRFGNLEANGVGWILLWNAKRLDWTFYVAQPIDSYSGNLEDGDEGEKCTLTAVSGFDASISDSTNFPDKLCIKVLNLCEAISNSHAKVRPLQPLMKSVSSTLNNPHYPTIHSALSDLPEKPCVLLRLQKTRQINILQNCVLAVRPVQSEKIGVSYEFQLVSRLQKEVLNGTVNEGVGEEKRRSRRRQKVRCDSMTSGSPVIKVLKNVHLQIEGRRSSSLSAPIVRKKPPELMVTEPDEEPKPATRAVSHSFLDVLFHRRRSSDTSEKKSRSPAESRSSTPTRNRRRKHKHRSSSISSQEDNLSSEFLPLVSSSANCVDLKKDAFVDEVLMISKRGDLSDFRALGDKCIAALIRENVKVSLIDFNMTEDEQKSVSSGWVFKETTKDVTVFKKTCLSHKGNVISYLRKGLIAACYKTVWKTLCDPLTRFMYDNSVKKISVLSELPPGQKLIHMYNESVSIMKKEVQDFCLLQTEKEEENRLILAFHSVEDPSCPLSKDIVRGTVITSGWILEKLPDTPQATVVSYLMQMLSTSPDNQLMEEISSTQCIHNLSAYLLATKPTTLKLSGPYEEAAS